MHPLIVLMHIAAAVLLLIWAVRMVRTGVERAHGPALRQALKRGGGGSIGMALAGMALAVVLQSSTAVGVLAAGFAASGILGVSAGVAALIGADLGSALVVKILSFDLSWLIPVLMIAGTTLFLKFEARSVRQSGRIVLGVAFVLLSLQMLGSATEPLRETAVLPLVVSYLRGDPLTAFAVSALLAWALHSSVATVLLLATFAGRGMLPLDVAAPMVMGANLGAGIIAVWLTRGMDHEARLIPLTNFAFRAVAGAGAMALILLVPLPFDRLGATEAGQLVNLHLLFNLALVLLALPCIAPMERLMRRLIRDPAAATALDPVRPASALDRSALASPGLALASVKRELLRMGELIETMFRPVMDLMDAGSPERIAQVRAQEAEVDRIHTEIKLYIAELRRAGLSPDEAQRGIELTDVAISLEHIGDIIAKSLLGLAEKKKARGQRFSPAGWAEMTALHARVSANMQMAMNVLVSGDLDSARTLAAEKEALRGLERESLDRHLARLQSGQADSIETSALHLEAVRALKEVNSLLVTVAYPILAESGQLLTSRLAPAR